MWTASTSVALKVHVLHPGRFDRESRDALTARVLRKDESLPGPGWEFRRDVPKATGTYIKERERVSSDSLPAKCCRGGRRYRRITSRIIACACFWHPIYRPGVELWTMT